MARKGGGGCDKNPARVKERQKGWKIRPNLFLERQKQNEKLLNRNLNRRIDTKVEKCICLKKNKRENIKKKKNWK